MQGNEVTVVWLQVANLMDFLVLGTAHLSLMIFTLGNRSYPAVLQQFKSGLNRIPGYDSQPAG